MDKKWFLDIKGQKRGPLSAKEVQDLYQKGELSEETRVSTQNAEKEPSSSIQVFLETHSPHESPEGLTSSPMPPFSSSSIPDRPDFLEKKTPESHSAETLPRGSSGSGGAEEEEDPAGALLDTFKAAQKKNVRQWDPISKSKSSFPASFFSTLAPVLDALKSAWAVPHVRYGALGGIGVLLMGFSLVSFLRGGSPSETKGLHLEGGDSPTGAVFNTEKDEAPLPQSSSGSPSPARPQLNRPSAPPSPRRPERLAPRRAEPAQIEREGDNPFHVRPEEDYYDEEGDYLLDEIDEEEWPDELQDEFEAELDQEDLEHEIEQERRRREIEEEARSERGLIDPESYGDPFESPQYDDERHFEDSEPFEGMAEEEDDAFIEASKPLVDDPFAN
jgi:hypothetical protein